LKDTTGDVYDDYKKMKGPFAPAFYSHRDEIQRIVWEEDEFSVCERLGGKRSFCGRPFFYSDHVPN